MNTTRIDFISACCSAFAVEAASGMCGGVVDALELAVGVPAVAGFDQPGI